MPDCKDALNPEEIARQLGYSLRGDPNPDPRGGYHPRKGFRKLPKVEGTDPHGVIVWAVDQTTKQD